MSLPIADCGLWSLDQLLAAGKDLRMDSRTIAFWYHNTATPAEIKRCIKLYAERYHHGWRDLRDLITYVTETKLCKQEVDVDWNKYYTAYLGGNFSVVHPEENDYYVGANRLCVHSYEEWRVATDLADDAALTRWNCAVMRHNELYDIR